MILLHCDRSGSALNKARDLCRILANLHVHHTCHAALKNVKQRRHSTTTGCPLSVKDMQKISHTRVIFLNKRPETPGQNFKYVLKQHSKIPGLQNFIFKGDLQCFTPRFCFSGLRKKAPAVQLFMCSSQKSGCCPASMDIHGWKSRKSSLSWAPAATLPWFKANAFYTAGVHLQLFLVSFQLLWKSSSMVAEGVPQGSSSSCCEKSRARKGLWSAIFCPAVPPHYWVTGDTALETTDSYHCRQGLSSNTCLQSVALCLPSLFSSLGPELKDSYEKRRFGLHLDCLISACLRGQDQGREGACWRISLSYNQSLGFCQRLWAQLSMGQGEWPLRARKEEQWMSWSFSGKRFTTAQTICLLSI